MSRGPFDTTVDLIYGAKGLTPGLIYSTRSCRFVPLLFPISPLIPFSNRVAYVTMDGPIVNVAQFVYIPLLQIYRGDLGFADLLAIPHGHAPNYQVLFVEPITYRSHPPYFRVHVQPYI